LSGSVTLGCCIKRQLHVYVARRHMLAQYRALVLALPVLIA